MRVRLKQISQRTFMNRVINFVFQFLYKLRTYHLFKVGVTNEIHFQVSRLQSTEFVLFISCSSRVTV
jgi:hypothetical protein